MANSERPKAPNDTVLGQLQSSILQSLFSGVTLPGTDSPLSLADLTFVTNQAAILLDTENLANSFSLPDLSKPIRLVSPKEIRELPKQGDVAYLHFEPVKIGGETLHFNLKVKLMSQAHAHSVVDLSGLQLRFHQVGDEWVVEDAPSQYAA